MPAITKVAAMNKACPSLPTRLKPAIQHLRQVVKFAINYRGQGSFFLRLEMFDLIRGFAPSLAVDLGGNWYFVSTADQRLSRIVFGQGSYEQDVMAGSLRLIDDLLGRAVLAGRTFIDIGANIGTSTIPAIRNFGASEAVSFEPEPRNYRLLRCNVVANDLEAKVRTFPFGLSDTPRTADLEWDAGSWGDHRVRLRADLDDGPYRESTRPIVEVQLVRFDDMVVNVPINLDNVGLVWMDVQGHEGYVLSGASMLLNSSIPIVTEYWPYGLRRADGLDLFHDLIATHYSQVVDVRRSMLEGRTVSLPADQIERLTLTYTDLDYTDLVLLS